MLLIYIYLRYSCHPERSSEDRNAILTAKSKHPYPHDAPSTGTTPQPSPSTADCALQKPDLLRPRPALQLFLAGQGLVHIIIRFKIEQTDHLVSGSEALIMMKLMLKHALVKIAADSNVQSARQASHDVNAVVAWIAHEAMIGGLGWCSCDGCHLRDKCLPHSGWR